MSKEVFARAAEPEQPALKILNAREMLLDLICSTMRLYYGDIVTALDCHLEYDAGENEYDLTFELREENSDEINSAVEKIATEYLTELQDLADKSVTAVNPKGGQLCIDTKSELLDLITDHCFKKGYRIANLSNPVDLPCGQTNSVEDYGTSVELYSTKALHYMSADNSYEEHLLSVAPTRLYLTYEAYLASAQFAAQNLNSQKLDKTGIDLSICIRLTEEKIKLEERKDPKINKAIFRPEFFLN